MRFFYSKKHKNAIDSNAEKAVGQAYVEVHKKTKGEGSMNNPLISLTETELRDLCRHRIDTFENWSRRLIDELFKNNYGKDYFDFMIAEG